VNHQTTLSFTDEAKKNPIIEALDLGRNGYCVRIETVRGDEVQLQLTPVQAVRLAAVLLLSMAEKDAIFYHDNRFSVGQEGFDIDTIEAATKRVIETAPGIILGKAS